MAKREELGLLMLEKSARGEGYHLVFRRKAGMSQEENLRWASELLGVEFDKGAKDITRVFFTTTANQEDLIYLEDEIFKDSPPVPLSFKEGETCGEGEACGEGASAKMAKGHESPSPTGEGFSKCRASRWAERGVRPRIPHSR